MSPNKLRSILNSRLGAGWDFNLTIEDVTQEIQLKRLLGDTRPDSTIAIEVAGGEVRRHNEETRVRDKVYVSRADHLGNGPNENISMNYPNAFLTRWLTPRERLYVTLYKSGYGYKAVQAILGGGDCTYSAHLYSIRRKFRKYVEHPDEHRVLSNDDANKLRITKTELQCWNWWAQGWIQRDIAIKVGVGVGTVRGFLCRVRRNMLKAGYRVIRSSRRSNLKVDYRLFKTRYRAFLNSAQSEVFKLRVLENYDIEYVAEKLGISKTYSSKLLNQALKRLDLAKLRYDLS